MPTKRAVIMWQRDHPEFARALEQARAFRADARIEAIHDISNKVLRGEIDPHAARVGLDNLWKLAGREYWNRWGEKQALAVAMQVATLDEAAAEQNTAARVEWLRRLRQLADRQQQGFARVEDGISLIPPDPPSKDITKAANPEPWQPPGDDSKLLDVTPPPPFEFRGEEPARGRRPMQKEAIVACSANDPGRLRSGCTTTRPTDLDRHRYEAPYVIANDHWARRR